MLDHGKHMINVQHTHTHTHTHNSYTIHILSGFEQSTNEPVFDETLSEMYLYPQINKW